MAGACPVCEGAGYEKVEMQFLPDAFVRCGACDGRRFRPEVLEIRCRGLSIAEALDLPAAEVARVFADARGVPAALQPLLDLGLGYLSLSQPAPTLSGGEAQRLKLARALTEASEGRGRLYLLDETGSVGLVKPGPRGFETVGRFRLLADRVRDAWAHPVLADGRLYLRYRDALSCYGVR